MDARDGTKRVAIACQGDGSHPAFTYTADEVSAMIRGINDLLANHLQLIQNK